MVYMSFPTTLTEEEKNLQKKYAELRKKKKMLAALRAQKTQETKEPAKESLKRENLDAADNTEQAKKLLKSGAIKLSTGKKGNQTFKRSKRQKDTEKSTVAFQPFSASLTTSVEEDKKSELTKSPAKMKALYDSFVPGRNQPGRREPPKRGNTVHVQGFGITEEIVTRAFSHYGPIVNITMEREKNCAFITFEKMDSADKAIAELNSAIVSEVKLRVSVARRQPIFEEANQDQSKATWATIAASSSQKGSAAHRDKRSLVVHDDDMFS